MSKKKPIEYSDEIINSGIPPLCFHIPSELLYIYTTKGYYEELTERSLRKLVFNHFIATGQPDHWDRHTTSSIVEAIGYHTNVTDIKKFNDYTSLINLKNGYIDLDEIKESSAPFTLHHHTNKNYFTSAVRVPYEPEAQSAPVFINLLKGIFKKNDGSHDKEMMMAIIRLGGYILYPQNKIESLFIFHGAGANGKSMIMEHVYKLFFTDDMMSSLSLNLMSDENSFSREDLATSRINFATEQKSTTIESEELKKIASGESITIDRKNRRSLKINPNCKILVSANRMPKFKDTSYGTDRRVIIFEFPNKFVSKEEYEREESPEDRGIYLKANKEKLIHDLKNEAPAILNMFLKALGQLRKDEWKFPETANAQNMKKEWRKDSDPIGTWLLETYYRDSSEKRFAYPVNKVLDDYAIEQATNNQHSKALSLTNRYISKRIKELFRIEGFTHAINTETKRTTTTAFHLRRKDDNTIYNKSSPEELAKQINCNI